MFVKLGDTLNFKFTTKDGNTVSAPDDTPTGEVFGENNTPLAGATVSVTGPINEETGLYDAEIDFTAANGFESGKVYTVVIGYDISTAAKGAEFYVNVY